jgi:uncharacterized protein involved in exopolysaccharide biosynthesis
VPGEEIDLQSKWCYACVISHLEGYARTPIVSASRKTTARPQARQPVAIAPQPAAYEPDPLGPLRGVVRRWPFVVAVTVLLLAAAVAAALAQKPTYTASADINVGRVDVRVQSLPGYVAGAQALASSYSRLATSDEIVMPLGRRLRLPPADVRSRLGASPVPEATMFRIYGSGESVEDAVRFTGAATDEIEALVKRTDSGEQEIADSLNAYRQQSRSAASLRLRIERLRDEQTAASSTSTSPTASPTPSAAARRRARDRLSDEIARLQVALDTAQLKMQVLGSRYQERGGELAATAGIQVISRPVTATSDRGRTLQRLLAIGLVAGLLLGAALALLVDRRRT